MKAIHVHRFFDSSDYDKSGDEYPATLETSAEKPANPFPKGKMLIQVLACSLSPGDINMIEGNFVVMHPRRFPFIPCHDVCARIVDANGSSKFEIGDIVVADNGMTPQGGLAEYMLVPESETVLKPEEVSIAEADASSSATTSYNAVFDFVEENARVLILGGSGGVGSTAIQLAKHHGKASFVATTSTQKEMCEALGADCVIDYRSQNWWEDSEFQEHKFDVIIDTVGGGNYNSIKSDQVLKSRKEGGTFVAVVGDHPKPNAATWWKAIPFLCNLLSHPLYAATIGRILNAPKYSLLMPHDEAEARKHILAMMATESLTIKLHGTPLPFNQEGVQKALQIVASGHAHGKVVISVSH